ncbi:ATP-binding protein [Pseudodonghicola flavimaris]|uniref:ATP-binding protein n=1 Tax=Pseudodonghicola flavimaris TaxID=3050036 RepID=A0ABT7F5X6_9RHOB|nr:ATP-binding protein [Pseudodonghicola flavimaris]MDK3019910.1 ATP-binding protein [Pseudodonghicola flavimaris]
MPERFTHRFRATELAARGGIVAVMARLRALELPEHVAGDVELALAEAVNNVTEHAYRGRSDGTITVTGRLEDTRLVLRISDHGLPMPEGKLPKPRAHDLSDQAELPEGGFGWGLIHALTSSVRYDRRAQRNTLSMMFDLSKDKSEKRTAP